MAEKSWSKLGALPQGALPKVVALGEGYGLIAAYTEPAEGSPTEQLRQRKAVLLRVTAAGAAPVYDGAGWIQALSGEGSTWLAVGATLKANGQGSDYRLLRSTDGGQRWQGQGMIPAPSVAQVQALPEDRAAWVLGAGYLGVTRDGGGTWSQVPFEGERNPTHERLRRVGISVALLGPGQIALSPDLGTSWKRIAVPGAQVHDFDGQHLVVSKDGRAGVGRSEGDQLHWLSGLPEGCVPLRITTAGSVVRVLARGADPSQGVNLTLYRSEDAGASWSAVPLEGLRAEADLLGDAGLGLTPRGEVLGHF